MRGMATYSPICKLKHQSTTFRKPYNKRISRHLTAHSSMRRRESLQEAKGKTALDTLGDTKAEALKKMLANTLPEAKSKTLDDILSDVEANALIDTLAGTNMWTSRYCSRRWLLPW